MKRWSLEMKSLSDLRPKDGCRPEFDVRKVELPFPELNRFLHRIVGSPWRWGGRENWGEKEWRGFASRAELETWLAYVSGTPAGYYEIERQQDGSVRVLCFGLREEFIGKGYGGYFLTHAVRRCWSIGANRVWLSTCTRDHPNALPNYQARGFRVVTERELPD